jgi:SET domain-containing protein
MRRTTPLQKDIHFKVGKSSAGLGIFAIETIQPGMYLEYVGNIIPTGEANKKYGAKYLFEINRTWTIDGSARSNIARYFNHSCEPNAESTVTGNRVFIMATRTINKGEEVTYDYGEEYVDEFIKPHGCRCHACALKKNVHSPGV